MVDVNVLNAGYEKMKQYNPSFKAALYQTMLTYKSGTRVRFLPGTNIPFTVKLYKEDLGVSYSRIVLYLLEVDNTDSEEDEFLDHSVFKRTR